MCDEDGDEIDDLLEAYRQRYDDEDGQAIHYGLAKLVNTIWAKGRGPKTLTTMFEKYPRPSNVESWGVDIIPDVINGLQKPARIHDMRLCAVQGSVARATVPSLKLAEKILNLVRSISRPRWSWT